MKLYHVAVVIFLSLLVRCECYVRPLRDSAPQNNSQDSSQNNQDQEIEQNCTENAFFATSNTNMTTTNVNYYMSSSDNPLKDKNLTVCIKTDVGVVKRDPVLFQCKRSGSFKDKDNCNTYWNCDVDGTGGFIAVRKKCPKNQIYNPKFQQCMYRNDRRCMGGDCQNENKCNQQFKCVGDNTIADDDRKPLQGFGLPPSRPQQAPSYFSSATTSGTTEKTNRFGQALFPQTTLNEFYMNKPPVEDQSGYNKAAVLDENDNSSISLINEAASTTESIPLAEFQRGPSRLHMPGTTSSTTCRTTTETSFMCSAEGTFSDPKSCTNFYLCHPRRGACGSLEALKIHCPAGTAYDNLSGKCTKEALISCISNQPPLDAYREKKSPKDSSSKENKFACRNVGRFADDDDCATYHLCFASGEGQLASMSFECPGDMLFDSEKSCCRPARTVLCKNKARSNALDSALLT